MSCSLKEGKLIKFLISLGVDPTIGYDNIIPMVGNSDIIPTIGNDNINSLVENIDKRKHVVP